MNKWWNDKARRLIEDGVYPPGVPAPVKSRGKILRKVMNSLKQALSKLKDAPIIGPMVSAAEKKVAAEKRSVKSRYVAISAAKEAEELREDILDQRLSSYENELKFAAEVGLPGFSPSSHLELKPGCRALHGDKPCVVKTVMVEDNGKSTLVIVRYEHEYDVGIPERKSAWAAVPIEEVKLWVPRRPK